MELRPYNPGADTGPRVLRPALPVSTEKEGVLRRGFEPRSRAREARMLGRTTPPEPAVYISGVKLKNGHVTLTRTPEGFGRCPWGP